MGNTLRNPDGWSIGDTIEPAQINGIDQGQAKAWVNDGTTDLAADAVVNGASTYTLTLENLVALVLGSAPQLSPPLAVSRHVVPFSFGLYAQNHGIDFSGQPTIADGCAWKMGFGGGLRLGVTTTGRVARLVLAGLPIGMTVTNLQVEVAGAGATALPATMPSAQLSSDGGSIVIASANDPSATLGAYVAKHTLSLLPSSTFVVASGKIYFLEVNSGTADLNFTLSGVYVSGTFSTLQFF